MNTDHFDHMLADQLTDLPTTGDVDFDPSRDANWFEARTIRQTERRDERQRKALTDPRRRRASYLDFALNLVAPELFVVLYAIASCARADLTGAYPSRRWIAGRLGITPNALKKRLERLYRAGYLRAIPFARENGRRTSSGFLFGLPAGVVDEMPWWGPEDFNDRAAAERVLTS